MSDDFWRLDATALAALVRAREVTSAELVEAAIARIERLNPPINAVITPLYDAALRQANDRSAHDGPFRGVPLLLKDASVEVEGTPYYLGTRVLRELGWRSPRTTELAHRFRHAGFIFLGKTNTPELSAGITTEPAAFGPARNPWNLGRTTGGSSGGSAAAVAAGMTAVAHGADGTGSLRYPAACCGVVTLKPSRGLVPCATPAAQPDPLGVWAEFVLARSVRDLAGILDVVCNAPLAQPHAETLRVTPPQLRIGLLTRDVMTGMRIDPECVTAVERAGALLASLGHDVDLAHPPALDGLLVRTARAIASVGAVARHAQVRWLSEVASRELTASDLEPETLTASAAAARVTQAEFADAIDAITREVAPIHDWWRSGYDLLVTPVLRQPPWALGRIGGAADAGVFPAPFSFSGQPAMSLPLHWTASALPVGVQIVAARGGDGLLLRVAAQVEAASPWADRWPAIAGA